MKKYLILLLAALLTLSYCKKPQEINNPGDNTESRDPSAGPQDPSAGPQDPSGSPSDYTPPTIPEDQVSDDPDFDVPDEPAMKLVDMGMAVKWASCNLGATSPEDPGVYLAWGETTVKDYYSVDTYKWGAQVQANNTWFNIFKYNTDWIVGEIDCNIVLDPQDDPATAALGEGWRLPTREEMEALLGSGYDWIPRDGGFEVKCLSTGESIFLPAAGLNYNDENSEDEELYYWTSTLAAAEGQNQAYCLAKNYDGELEVSTWNRFNGLSIRPVYGPAAQEPEPVVVTLYADGISPTGAQLSGGLYPRTSLSGVETGIIVSQYYEPTLDNSTRLKATSIDSDSRFTVNATGLQNLTEYYYRAYSIVDGNVQYGVIQYFRTATIKVSALAAEEVSEYKATIKGRLSAENYEDMDIKAYFLYSGEEDTRDGLIDSGTRCDAAIEKLSDGAASFSHTLTGLEYGKTYHYLLCVEIDDVPMYSDTRSFKTRTADVSFQLQSNKVAETTMELSGKITVDSQASLTKEFWLNYKADGSSSGGDKVRIEPDGSGKFTARLHGLKWNTKYILNISGTVQGISYESAAESITTRDFKMRSVDLGLSIKKDWANMNLGATGPAKLGDKYCWGMVEDIYDRSKWHPDLLPDDFPGYEQDLLNHKIAHYQEEAVYTGLSKWMKDGNNAFGESWDVAAVKLGGTWRVPTSADFAALFAECDIYDYPYADAIEVVSRVNGNAIIIPKTSSDETLYWSSSANDNYLSTVEALAWSINGRDDIKKRAVTGWIPQLIRPVRVL